VGIWHGYVANFQHAVSTMWHSQIEIEPYSVAYFNHITTFKVLQHRTSVKRGAHMRSVGAWILDNSTPLTEVLHYSALNAVMRSNKLLSCLNFNTTKIELMHSKSQWVKPEGLLLECSIGYQELRWPKLKCTWQLTPCLLTAGYPQAVQISITTVVEVASGKGHA